METVGFIGTGIMGLPMAEHLLKAGHPLNVYNRTKERADALVGKGAIWCDTVGEIAAKSDVVITMVGFPKDVESIYLEPSGILNCVRSGSVVIDMTTSSPELAVRIFREAHKKRVASLDAPVSGGDIGAREARLAIMVGGDLGGDQEAFDGMLPIFKRMGGNIGLMGSAGAGQHTKMSNQIAIAANMVGVSEAMAYARRGGLDAMKVIACIKNGAAGSVILSHAAPHFLQGNFGPGFFVKHFIKDLTIAIASADKLGLALPGLELAKGLYDQLAASGGENYGAQALFKLYED